MKDKNGKPILKEDAVVVPAPDSTDIHNHEFIGTVNNFRNGYVVVEDGEGEFFQIEPERLEVVIN